MLDAFKGELGESRPEIINRLIQEYSNRAKQGLPIATFQNLLIDPVPAVIAGLPYSGKSYSLDIFLKEAARRQIPFLLLNSGNSEEHDWIQNALTFYEAASFRWLENPSQYRIEFERDLDLRRSAVREISRSLLRLEGDKRLQPWILSFEEAHDYSRIEPFLTLLRRMRKSTRKLIVIATEPDLFKMCRPFRPLSRT